MGAENIILRRGARWWFILPGALAMVQILNCIALLTMPAILIDQISLIVPLELIFSGFWAGLFLFFAYRAWRRQMSVFTLLVLLSAYAGYTTMHSIVFVRADYNQGRIPFQLLIVVTFIFLTIMAYWFEQRKRQL